MQTAGERDARAGHDDLAERVRLIEVSLPNALAGTLICLAASLVLLHDTLSPRFLWPWYALQLAACAARFVTAVRWRPPAGSDARLRLRLGSAIAHAVVSGSLWGAFGYVAVGSGDVLATLVAVMVITGLIGGATAMIGHLPVVYLPYVLCTAALPAARLLTVDGSHGLDWTGALLAFYALFSIIASRGGREHVRQSIALRYRNADLLDGLREARDRTEAERRRAEAALERERRANLAKSRFLAAASHDLRQPLHSLRLHAATLRTRTRGGEHEGSAILIDRSVGALEELFEAILDISKLDAGTLRPSVETVRLAPLVDALVEELRPQALAGGLALSAEPTEAVLRTDPVLLGRLLRNLLGNALRYTAAGEVRVRAVVRDGGALDVQVIDTGPGIAPEARERVFEEFVQLDNPERDRGQGIGLGLSIVQRIAALLELRVRLDDTPGGGTTATLSIPPERVVVAAVPRLVGTSPTPAAPTPLDATVLVIDDERDVLEALALFLDAHGCTVLAADSGDAAIAALDRADGAPDSIVCDYRLRGDERGTDTIRRVREHCGREVPAVLVTGDVAAERLREIGASGLRALHKPCDPHELLELLRRDADGDADGGANGGADGGADGGVARIPA